jgi:hypothetical protein
MAAPSEEKLICDQFNLEALSESFNALAGQMNQHLV